MSPETLRRSALEDLKQGSKVNLEGGLAVGARNSGHYVQGHVDGTGSIKAFRREKDSLWVTIAASADLLRFIVEKGFIAVDGTSLTVCEVTLCVTVYSDSSIIHDRLHAQVNSDEGWFNLMLISHTQTVIIMPHVPVGGRVNLEVDVMAKYASQAVSSKRLEDCEKAIVATRFAAGAAIAALAAVLVFTRKQ